MEEYEGRQLTKLDYKWKGNQVYHIPFSDGNKRKVVIKKCSYCEEKFPVRINEVKRDNGKFCSRSCSTKHQHANKDFSGHNNPSWKGKRSYIRKIKEESECATEKCNEDHSACLVFHHTDPETKVEDITRMAGKKEYSKEDLQKEVEKCELICRNCHAKKHYKGTYYK